MPYLTPDTMPSDVICRTVLIPNHIDWLIIVNGALSELLNAARFEQFGSITPEETANRFEQMFFEFRDSECFPMTPIGGIMMFAATAPPEKWLVCEGQAISRATYSELFAVIGEAYGSGDFSTTFNIPNFIDRSPMGTGGDFTGFPGATFGEHEITLTEFQMPQHDHPLFDPGHDHRIPKRSATVDATKNNPTPAANTDNLATPTMRTDSAVTGITMGFAGDGLPHGNVHPVLGVTFLIYTGVSP